MKYIVIELQESADGQVANIVTSHDTANEAESKYHAVLSAAAVSSVPVHSAIMVNSHGGYINSQSYDHTGETE
jgi:hypothetical protein